jgi:hypothetical protein
MHTNQALYRSQAGRYARLSELNGYSDGVLGKVVGTTIRHRDFIYVMFPNPTDESLRTDFNIIAYRVRSGRIVSHYQMAQNGTIVTVLQ